MAFQQIGKHRRTQTRRRTHTHLDVIAIRFQGQERQLVPLTTVRQQAFGFRLHLTREYLSARLWYPDQVISNRLVGISGFPHVQRWLIHATIVP